MKKTASGRGSDRSGEKKSRDSVVRVSSAELAGMEDRSDWARVDALSDEEIDRAIADDPDAAPVLDESFWRNAEILDPRHAKSTITMRVDDDVIDFFKRGGAGYQSRMNAVLRAYVYARRERSR
jgi:uncharacterized protein (DUF4415 family)